MGQVFQRTYRAADGSVRKCRTWTIRYFRNGKPHEEATEKVRKTDAQTVLRLREGDIAKGLPVSPAYLKLTFDEAAQDVINDFKSNGKRSLAVVERRITKHLTPYFGGRRLSEITTGDVRAFIAHRQSELLTVRKERVTTLPDGRTRIVPAQTKTVSNAEINRELQILKRCFSLAIQSGKLLARPHIPMLRESAARAGFFERAQFESVQAHLPEALRPLIEFAYITGWRVPSEVQPLQWHQVDFGAGTVRLDAGTTKNGEGRLFPMTASLRRLLELQRDSRDQLKAAGTICPWVFFRLVADERGGKKKPKPIIAFTKAWKHACAKAGCPGRIPHDLRRTAVRNLVRSGVPERVAMQMTGHRTPSVFARYNIVSEADLFDAARRYEERDSRARNEASS